jgi:quercetin dioxygenase-like cupin family protein
MDRHGRHALRASKARAFARGRTARGESDRAPDKGARIKFAPGQRTGLHRHPISTVGVVTAGSFHLQLEGKPVQVLKTGDSFFEPAGHTILKFDNASTSEPAEIVCFYLADTKERPPIEMLAGGMDSQLGNDR